MQIETYVAWNLHQPSKNEFYFGGFGDIAKFLKICQKVGLLVILRPTPYICAGNIFIIFSRLD